MNSLLSRGTVGQFWDSTRMEENESKERYWLDE